MKEWLIGLVIWATSTTTFATTVFGNSDCGQWLHNPTPAQKAWLAGFISGMNIMYDGAVKQGSDPLEKVNSVEQLVAWMDNYCRTNPLKTVGAGAQALFIELMTRK